MPLKRIDIFAPPLSQYGVLHHFTQKLFEALSRTKVSCRLLQAEKNNPKPFLEKLFQDPPQCTLSFNGLLADNEDRFFCDMIRIPHVCCLVDSPVLFLSLVKSPYNIITCVDRYSCQFFRELGFKNVFFLPHAIEKELSPEPNADRNYDVVMPASCIDYEANRLDWPKKHSKAICKVLDEAAEITLSDQETSYIQAFFLALNHQTSIQGSLDPQKIDFISALDDLEMFIRGKDRVELVRAIKDAKVDIFGSSMGTATWEKYLGKRSNITIHEAVPYEQVVSILKHSKIVLNSCAWIKDGAHERIFTGLACGALPMTSENPYMREQFKDEDSILFYQHQKWDKASHKINEFLSNPSKREKAAAKGREIVMKKHTWDQRAKELLKQLQPMLPRKTKAAV